MNDISRERSKAFIDQTIIKTDKTINESKVNLEVLPM